MGNYCFENCDKLKKVELGSTLQIIPEGTFSGCSKLETLMMNKGVYKIDKYAFSQTNIKKIEFPSTISYVGSMIFKDNLSSIKVVLPNNFFDTTKWATDWNDGLVKKHKFLKILNPVVKIKAKR